MTRSIGADRQRGFSLIVVFLIVLVMVGISSAVMFTTQGDLQVSGHERETQMALYAAEAGVAWGEAWAFGVTAPLSNQWAWTSVLNATPGSLNASAFCVYANNQPVATLPPQQLPAVPVSTLNYAVDGSNGYPAPGQLVNLGTDPAHGGSSFQWCVHNNSLDPAFTGQGVQAANCPGAAGAYQCDLDGVITIESWGYGPNGASAHLSVDVSYPKPSGNAVASDYDQAGGNSRKSGGAGGVDPQSFAAAAQRAF